MSSIHVLKTNLDRLENSLWIAILVLHEEIIAPVVVGSDGSSPEGQFWSPYGNFV